MISKISKSLFVNKIQLKISLQNYLFSKQEKCSNNKKFKGKIIFFGSDKVAYPSLKALFQYYNQNISVVTHFVDHQKTKKNSNQVETFSKNNNIKFYTPITQKKSKQIKQSQWLQFNQVLKKQYQNQNYQQILGVVCSYGYMIPNHIIDFFTKGMFVIHPSILPKYRGGAPIFHAIANGQKQSGVSFIDIAKGKFDSGNILFLKTQDINSQSSYSEVQKQLSELCAKYVIEVIENIDFLRPGKAQTEIQKEMKEKLSIQEKQILQKQLKAPLIKSKNLVFKDKTTFQIYNWSRALQTPRVKFNNKQIIIQFYQQFCQFKQIQESSAMIINNENKLNIQIGCLILKGKKLFMKCKDKYIRLKAWQQPTKKQLQIYTFTDRFMSQYKKKGSYPSQLLKFQQILQQN